MEQNNIPADVQERIPDNNVEWAEKYLSLQKEYNQALKDIINTELKYAELKKKYDGARSALDTKQCELLREIGENNAVAERAQKLVDALEEAKWELLDLYNDKGDSGSPLTEKIDLILQQWKDRKDKGNATDSV